MRRSSAYNHAMSIIGWDVQNVHAAPTLSYLLCAPARSPITPLQSCATGTTIAAPSAIRTRSCTMHWAKDALLRFSLRLQCELVPLLHSQECKSPSRNSKLLDACAHALLMRIADVIQLRSGSGGAPAGALVISGPSFHVNSSNGQSRSVASIASAASHRA